VSQFLEDLREKEGNKLNFRYYLIVFLFYKTAFWFSCWLESHLSKRHYRNSALNSNTAVKIEIKKKNHEQKWVMTYVVLVTSAHILIIWIKSLPNCQKERLQNIGIFALTWKKKEILTTPLNKQALYFFSSNVFSWGHVSVEVYLPCFVLKTVAQKKIKSLPSDLARLSVKFPQW